MGYASDFFKIFTAAAQGGVAWNNDEGEAAAANFGSAAVSLAFWKFKNYGSDALKKAYKEELWILEISIVVLQLAEVILLGNANEKGDKFKTASRDFELALRSLEDAVVNPRYWEGDAADAYNEQNADQMARVQLMAQLDLQVPGILKTEAAQVKKMRAVSAECRLALTGCIPVGYYILANYGPSICMAFQLASAMPPMMTAYMYFLNMEDQANDNAKAVNALMDQYMDVVGKAAAAIEVLSSSAPSTPVAKASTSTVSEFESLSAPPASVPYTPASAASSSAESERAPLFASAVSTSADDSPSDDAPVEVTADGDVPPAYTVPTLSQVVNRASEASTQAAKFSEEAAATVSLVNEIVGTVDQINSMAQSAAPAEDVAEPPPTDEPVDGAAAGAENAELAPVAAGGIESSTDNQRAST